MCTLMWGILALLLWSGRGCDASTASSVQCGACSLLVSELETDIAKVDPKKTIQIGSFRVDPNGNQEGLNEIPYARSEVYITELLEGACAKSSDYMLVVNPATGKTVYRRVDSTKLRGDKSRPALARLESVCSDFLDDHEEELVKFMKSEHDDPVRQFCQQQLSVCSSVDVTPFPDVPDEPETPPENTPEESNEEEDKDEL